MAEGVPVASSSISAVAGATILALSTIAASPAQTESRSAVAAENNERKRSMTESHPYVGMWVTADGRIRHQLLPGGRYDEARGTRESAYQGRYVVTGDHIDYVDDTGFTADGDFVDGVLHHGGMVLRRDPERTPAAASRTQGTSK